MDLFLSFSYLFRRIYYNLLSVQKSQSKLQKSSFSFQGLRLLDYRAASTGKTGKTAILPGFSQGETWSYLDFQPIFIFCCFSKIHQLGFKADIYKTHILWMISEISFILCLLSIFLTNSTFYWFLKKSKISWKLYFIKVCPRNFCEFQLNNYAIS